MRLKILYTKRDNAVMISEASGDLGDHLHLQLDSHYYQTQYIPTSELVRPEYSI